MWSASCSWYVSNVALAAGNLCPAFQGNVPSSQWRQPFPDITYFWCFLLATLAGKSSLSAWTFTSSQKILTGLHKNGIFGLWPFSSNWRLNSSKGRSKVGKQVVAQGRSWQWKWDTTWLRCSCRVLRKPCIKASSQELLWKISRMCNSSRR